MPEQKQVNMGFKFFEQEQVELNNFITFRPVVFNPQNVEFCFQFGDDEPIVFGTGPTELNIRISPTRDGNIIFNDNGKVFKIFARERQ